MTTQYPTCENSCTPYVRNECNWENGMLTFIRECNLESCQSVYEEANACSTWSEWSNGSVGDCIENFRTVERKCILGENSETDFNCSGNTTKVIDCVPNKYFDSCICNDSVGTLERTCIPGSDLHFDDICSEMPNEDCSDRCPVWTAWGSWTDFFPSCVDKLDKHNPEKYMPKRIRERDCQFSNGTLVLANHESGNCPFSDKMETERQTLENYTQCEPTFKGVEIDEETEILTEVIVGFEIEIYEEWNDDLEDPQSDAFTDLAEIYIKGFLEALQDINEVNGTSKIQFATVRIVAFVLMPEETVDVRKKRSIPQDKIKAEFETVYDIIAPKASNIKDNDFDDIEEKAKNIINVNIAAQISNKVIETIEEKIDPENLNHKAGELNFLRVPEKEKIITNIQYEARYSTYFIMDCNCNTGKSQDYHECIDVSFTSDGKKP